MEAKSIHYPLEIQSEQTKGENNFKIVLRNLFLQDKSAFHVLSTIR